VFVPAWHEAPVIGQMLEHNIAAIHYSRYEFFVGAYPNDEPTQAAVREVEQRFANVHLCLCPHDGPTSKADCLNWIYQGMLVFEEETGTRFDVIVTHDSEDLIHPESFRRIGEMSSSYGMVQIPVLPLPTPWREFVHGLYCDDFAEYHTKDLPVRQRLGGFVPSSGVGTGYSRWALEKLAAAESNRVFEPSSLTEDYENGFRLKLLDCLQAFVPIRFENGAPVATREYFPRRFRAAWRQRTRWVTGIALQSWQRHGWSGGRRQLYWLWRDRKGLVGNPASLFANCLFIYGLLTWFWARWTAEPWGLGAVVAAQPAAWLLVAALPLSVIHLAFRAACVARIFGWPFAGGVPFRAMYGNILNTLATLSALRRYLVARWRHEPLVWVKTEHAYPSRAALMQHKRPLEEILVGSSYISSEQLEQVLATKPADVGLGEHLVRLGLLDEEQLCEVLSLQQSIPAGRVEPHEVPSNVARALPAHLVHRWRVLPFRIASGNMYLASPQLPSDELQRTLRRFTHLETRFHLVTPSNFLELQTKLL